MIVLVSLSITYFELSVVIKSILILIFIFLTVPVAAHLIAGTGHFLGVKKWSKTILDEWQEKDK
jgi:multicomponent Na+:H+ antiporter subunit G